MDGAPVDADVVETSRFYSSDREVTFRFFGFVSRQLFLHYRAWFGFSYSPSKRKRRPYTPTPQQKMSHNGPSITQKRIMVSLFGSPLRLFLFSLFFWHARCFAPPPPSHHSHSQQNLSHLIHLVLSCSCDSLAPDPSSSRPSSRSNKTMYDVTTKKWLRCLLSSPSIKNLVGMTLVSCTGVRYTSGRSLSRLPPRARSLLALASSLSSFSGSLTWYDR